MIALHCVRQLGVLACLLSLIGCSNGRGSLEEGAEAAPAQEGFTVGGSVSGLTGSGLILQNNGGSDLAVSANGSFAFTASFTDGTSYNVTVLSQPSNPGQICTIANGSGRIAGGNVTNIAVTCATATFAVRGTVTGLLGSGLVLQNNAGDDLAIAADGSFGFAAPLAAGAAYTVTVRTQPANPSQTCTIANATGTVGDVDVTNVAVTCVTGGFSIGGAVSGLAGSGLVLQNNGGDDLTIAASGNFVFAGQVASGAPYNVGPSVARTSPAFAVSCTTSEFTIGGAVGGLSGSGLVLQNNGADNLTINADGSFTFATALQSGSTYNITIVTQPTSPTQTCTLSNASGTVGSTNVTTVTVNCVTSQFTVGGTVSGLSGTGLVLQNNGSDDLAIAANGVFTCLASLPSGTPYSVTVASQPTNPLQLCGVENGSGTVSSANITDVAVNCTTIGF